MNASGRFLIKEEVLSLESRRLVGTYNPERLVIDKGLGCQLVDVDGNEYLDFISGVGTNALGYGHPKVMQEMFNQGHRCIATSNVHTHQFQALLAQRLAEWSGLDRVFFSNSGSEAVEAALKAAIARANVLGKSSAHHVVALQQSFHGRTLGALTVTGQERYRAPFQPLGNLATTFVPPNDAEALRRAVRQDTIAVISETVQGQGGIKPLSEHFVHALRVESKRVNALWIADETQCGLGRTGERFAYHRFNVGLPDVVATAKPLGCGLPLGATMFSNDSAAALTRGTHGNTYGGGPLACCLGLVFLEEVDRLLPAIRDNGALLAAGLCDIAKAVSCVRDVRVVGLMAGIELDRPAGPLVRFAREAGLLVDDIQGNLIRLLPPYIVTAAEVERATEILYTVLRR